MLETAQVSSTVLKFSTPSSPAQNTRAEPLAQTQVKTEIGDSPAENSINLWDCEAQCPPDSLNAQIKIEPSETTFETITIQPAPPADFAELKPIPFDCSRESLTLSSKANSTANTKKMPDITSPLSSRPSSSTFQYNSSSQSDVTSSGSSSPPGITKLETLDFTASQDAFDDLASIVGISMGADSTVPNIDGDMDLDAWIENTAQNIKPLVGDNTLETAVPNSLNHHSHHHHPHHLSRGIGGVNSSPSYVQMGPASGSTLQSLLQGTLTPNPPTSGKVTQLQQREQQPPPPYSILQNRLQNGASGPLQITSNNVVKVDSTYDLMKIASEANNNNTSSPNSSSNNTYLSAVVASYADTLPHSTQTPLNHVSTSDPSLHKRLGELGGLAKIKAKQNKMRQKMAINGAGHGNGSVGGVPGGDQGKKMMHHCQICNRGFLNKSNIKVHLRTHTGEKPFKCEHCSKAFRQKAHLLKHMSIHKRISRD